MLRYTAKGGGKVKVPKVLDPYEQLGITPSTSSVETKKLFKQALARPKRQDRALTSLAYHMITSTSDRYSKRGTHFEIKNPDIFLYACIGHTEKVLEEISKNPMLLNAEDERKRSVLYLTSRGSFYDTTEALIRKKANVNQKQANDSTPLHVAAFYGQNLIVKLLLVHGADPSLKNRYGNTPADESTPDIKEIFENFKKDPISLIVHTLTSSDLVDSEIHHISYEGKSIAREIFCNSDQLNPTVKRQWNRIKREWEITFHGTKYKNIKSIIQHGLLPSGSTLPSGEMIKPPSNHYQLEKMYFEVENWANAVFVSPSLLYASHACYSERVIAGQSQFCVVLKVLVEPSSYKSYNPTVIFDKSPIDGEPENSEYRVHDSSVEESIFRILHRIMGIEDIPNVIVESVLFIDLDFLENISDYKLSYTELRKLFSQ